MTETIDEPMILSHRDEVILCLTLNRPHKSNSLHPDLITQLTRAISDAEHDEDLVVVIITGAGRNFCAGLDLEFLTTWNAERRSLISKARQGCLVEYGKCASQ